MSIRGFLKSVEPLVTTVTGTPVDGGGELQVVASGGSAPYSYLWVQTSGDVVTLDDPTSDSLSFVGEAGTYTFEVTTTDSFGRTSVDSVTIIIKSCCDEVSEALLTLGDGKLTLDGQVGVE